MFPYSRIALVEIELMIGLFLVFEVIEPQRNYTEELYDPDKYKLTWMLVVAFSALRVYFYIYISNMHICNSYKIHFETVENSLL